MEMHENSFECLDEDYGVFDMNNYINKENRDSGNCRERFGGENLMKMKTDLEEKLIIAVQERDALWNILMPLEKRSKRIKEKLWQEVCESLNGAFTATGAKNKFKNLVDTYRNILKNEHCASGSARKAHQIKWIHYEAMEFMRAQLYPRRTTSNSTIEEEDPELETLENEDDIEIHAKGPTPTKRQCRKRKSSEHDSLAHSFDKVADAIIASRKEIVLPSPPVLTEIEACLQYLSFPLNKIPKEFVSQACEDLMLYGMRLVEKYK